MGTTTIERFQGPSNLESERNEDTLSDNNFSNREDIQLQIITNADTIVKIVKSLTKGCSCKNSMNIMWNELSSLVNGTPDRTTNGETDEPDSGFRCAMEALPSSTTDGSRNQTLLPDIDVKKNAQTLERIREHLFQK